MNISQLKLTLIIILLAITFSVRCYAGKPTLNNPKYAKLILSEDGSNILVIAIDTTSKENDRYTILYSSKDLDGTFKNIQKTPGRTKYKFSILNSVRFSSLKFPPVYNKNAEHETKVNIEHWCNQAKIWHRDYKKRKRRNFSAIDRTPQKDLYATVHYKIRQNHARWDYHIRRAINTSKKLKYAPVCDFREKPELRIDLVPSKKSKGKRGLAVYLYYAGSTATSIRDNHKFVDNEITWERANEKPKVDIVIKKNDGTRINSYEIPLSRLHFRWLGNLDARQRAKTEEANYFVRVPDKGGIIEVTLDAGPLFGVLKVTQELK
ncbi:MAG: hypothetical protein DRI44_04095 [Chlamydiae bacterium]|nr:MAG: hypothetical protein DRI44_04095 [Chlamydiota bacterium]